MTIINLASNSYDGTVIIGSSKQRQIGVHLDSAGDFDGDGFDDLMVGAGYDDDEYPRGEVYIFTGSEETLTKEFTFTGPAADYNNYGLGVASIGNFNGDGFDDVAIADRRSGDISVVFGRPDSGEGGGFDIEGVSLFNVDLASAGDVNGDGLDDLLIGLPQGNSAYVIFGKRDGHADIDLSDLSASEGYRIQGDDDQLIVSVASAGDMNDDGYDDVLIGSPGVFGSYDNGAAYVVFGKEGGFGTVDLETLAPGEGFALEGNGNGSFARTVSSAGDINGDGFDDIAIAGQGGRIYVVFGGSGGFGGIDLDAMGPGEGFEIKHDFHGVRADGIASAGDINGDGYDDLLIGRPDVNDKRGEAYLIYGRAGGFEGIDLLNLDSDDGFVLRGDDPDDFAGGTVAGAGDLNGDGYDDILIGAPGYNAVPGRQNEVGAVYVIYGGERFAATDFRGGLGNDRAAGGTRADFLSGGAGDDVLSGRGADDYLRGGNGDDVLGGGDQDDRLDGGQGTDTASYRSATAGVTVDLTLGTQDTSGAGTDTLISIENLIGSDHADNLFGSSVRNLIEGGDGDDYMEGRGGGDRFEGGRGMDTVSYAWASTGVRASLNTTEPQQTNVGLDRFIGVENLRGTAADDVLAGNPDANRLFGGAGDDRLIGNAGGDIMYGGAGRDLFLLRPGDSGLGAPGAADTIADFSRFEGDRIDLRRIDAVVGTGSNEAFTFIGTASFSGQAGELRYSGNGTQKVVRGDIDGDRIADFAIVVGQVNALAATDFIL
ncbi:MAG TPA: hypothetical protein VF589_04800 [Allosphingosinicella sp.]